MNTPISDAALRAKRPALYGGSFDPVHAGHLFCARMALEHGGFDHVVFVPAARSPLKASGPSASGPERVAMLEQAVAGDPRFSVWDTELARPAPSYSVDTVRAFLHERGERAPERLGFVLGGDHLEALSAWRDVERLFELAAPVVVAREVDTRAHVEALAGRLSPALVERLLAGLIEVEPFELSASELRARLAAGRDPGELLPPGVWTFVRGRGLYRG